MNNYDDFKEIIQDLETGNNDAVKHLTQEEANQLISYLFDEEVAGLKRAKQSTQSAAQAAWLQGKALVALKDVTPQFKATWDADYAKGLNRYSYKTVQRRMDLATNFDFEDIKDKSMTACLRLCKETQDGDNPDISNSKMDMPLTRKVKAFDLSLQKTIKQWHEGAFSHISSDDLIAAKDVVKEAIMDLGHFHDDLDSRLGVQ